MLFHLFFFQKEMNHSKNAWIIFVVGMIFIAAEWLLPGFVQEHTIQIPINTLGSITVIGPLGVILIVLSVIKLLGYIPAWDQIFPYK